MTRRWQEEEVKVGGVWLEVAKRLGSFPVQLEEQHAAGLPSWQGVAS